MTGKGGPFSLFLPLIECASCRIGLDTGVFLTVVGVDGAGLGELVDFFWKKPRMDFWFFADCEAEGGCFFCEGRGVDISLPSTPRTMIAVVKKEVLEIVMERLKGDLSEPYLNRSLIILG
jgi:hypothetical protein